MSGTHVRVEICPHHCGAYQEEVLEAVNDGVDAEDGLPVLPQNVEANIAVQVNIWMKDLQATGSAGYPSCPQPLAGEGHHLRFALDLGRIVRVGGRDVKAEGERAGPAQEAVNTSMDSHFKANVYKTVRVDALLGLDGNLKL